MISTFLISLLLSVLPTDETIVINVEKIELNHFYGDDGRHVLDQMIFWRAFGEEDRIAYHVVGWQLLSDCRKFDAKEKEKWDEQELKKKEELRLPYNPPFTGHIYLPNFKNGLYESRILDYTIRARSYHDSHTQYDPEIYDKGLFPIDGRHIFLNIPSQRNHEKYRRLSTEQPK